MYTFRDIADRINLENQTFRISRSLLFETAFYNLDPMLVPIGVDITTDPYSEQIHAFTDEEEFPLEWFMFCGHRKAPHNPWDQPRRHFCIYWSREGFNLHRTTIYRAWQNGQDHKADHWHQIEDYCEFFYNQCDRLGQGLRWQENLRPR